jgi:uncharacterized protein YjbJ (UPF0337 family)
MEGVQQGCREPYEETAMNWDIIEGNWTKAKGKVKEQWGKLTDDDLATISGKRDQLAGKLQQRYGIAKDEVEKQLEHFEHSYAKRN